MAAKAPTTTTGESVMDMIERAARAIREEIVRQYRDDERGKCPAGSNFYEEDISPYLIARAILTELREPDEGMIDVGFAVRDRGLSPAAIWQAMIDTALEKNWGLSPWDK